MYNSAMWFSRFFERAALSTQTGSDPLFLHNTLGNELQEFTLPPAAHTVRMYNCGPTVYGRQHIGNLSMFVFTDILRKTLEYNGFKVKQVINITDFGHLVSDADEGEDKMTKGLKREKMKVTIENMRTLAEKYTDLFFEDIRALGIDTEKIQFPRASDYIPAQIAMILALEQKGYAYQGAGGMYFDTARFPSYGQLGGIDLTGLKEGARVAIDTNKKSPTDFLLWKLDKKLGWESPWGKGFPGWHIECSAMIRKTLGEQIDIHTGGIEHIPVHHNNEIAQSECATGKRPLSRFWLHRAHLQIEGGKIAKSAGKVIYLSEILERGFHPLAFRYLLLGAHYRTAMNFSWESLTGAQTAYLRLRKIFDEAPEGGTAPAHYMERFRERVNDDLDTPGAVSVLWEVVKDESLTPADIRAGLYDADRILGLGFNTKDSALDSMTKRALLPSELPPEAAALLEKRATARAERDWSLSDSLRNELDALGYSIDDTLDGTKVYKK